MSLRWAVYAFPFLFLCHGVASFVIQSPTSSKELRNQRLKVMPVVDLDSQPLTTFLLNHAEEAVGEGGAPSFLTGKAVLWTVGVQGIIVGLLYLWETSVETIREKIPKALLPVVESMLGEIGGLGFIGLVLGMVLDSSGRLIEEISEEFLNDGEALVGTFEHLHEVYFQVGIGYFLFCGYVVNKILGKINQLRELESLGLDSNGVCKANKAKMASILGSTDIRRKSKDGKIASDSEILLGLSKQPLDLVRQLLLTEEERGAEALLLREYTMRRESLPNSFRIEKYLELAFAENLGELVELTPFVWLPVIPAISRFVAADFSHNVLNAGAPNALDSAGFFFSSTAVLGQSALITVLSVAWGFFNFWKVAQVKSMVLPKLVREKTTGDIEVLPPLVENQPCLETFASSQAILKPLEDLVGKPARNNHEALFGGLGANGPKFFASSIKFQVWLCLSGVIFLTTQILFRDINALVNHLPVGDPDGLVPEFLAYGSFVALAFSQLLLFPATFQDFCVATSVHDMINEAALEEAIEEGRVEATNEMAAYEVE